LCGINGPLWKRVEAEEQGAVGVDGDVGRQDADDVQGKSGLHHVRGLHGGGLQGHYCITINTV